MLRSLAIMFSLAVALTIANSVARAQYYYPYGEGYGGYGFGGWGQTVQGSIAAGMGAFAAAAGQYNYETAAANSVNADTVMRWNQYIWASQNSLNRERYARLAAEDASNKAAYEAIRKRIQDNPTDVDISRGDALNAILHQLTDPKFLQGSGLARATSKIDASTVRNIPFRYAPAAVVITIDRYKNDIPPLLQSKEVEKEREAFKAALLPAVAKIKAGEEVTEEDAQKVRTTGRALFQKVETGLPNATLVERKAALDYLKSLKAFLKMLANPDIAKGLRELDSVKSTTVGNLIAFMHTFNLRFGPAKSTDELATYRSLYPVLAAERDRLLARESPGYNAPVPEPPIPTDLFKGIENKHLEDSKGGR